jgi:hypothetical protein
MMEDGLGLSTMERQGQKAGARHMIAHKVLDISDFIYLALKDVI